ncbi:MAG: hypothetical protein M3Z04_07910 [Chloroflexota bacterium]|nr:hypothetical protein [Chloroflexota bacterium]
MPKRVVAAVFVLVGCILLAACGSTPASLPLVVVPTATSPAAQPTATTLVGATEVTSPSAVASLPPPLATDIAKNTQIANYPRHVATYVALTHAPTRTPGGPPIVPSPTLQLGISGGCSSPNAEGFVCHNAWQDYRNGHLVVVEVGRQGRNDDVTQGEVHIFTQGIVDIYPVPSKTGTIDIVSVEGDILTVTAVTSPNHETFTFNLQTHAWVPTTPVVPSVSPSAVATPVPSVAPSAVPPSPVVSPSPVVTP